MGTIHDARTRMTPIHDARSACPSRLDHTPPLTAEPLFHLSCTQDLRTHSAPPTPGMVPVHLGGALLGEKEGNDALTATAAGLTRAPVELSCNSMSLLAPVLSLSRALALSCSLPLFRSLALARSLASAFSCSILLSRSLARSLARPVSLCEESVCGVCVRVHLCGFLPSAWHMPCPGAGS